MLNFPTPGANQIIDFAPPILQSLWLAWGLPLEQAGDTSA